LSHLINTPHIDMVLTNLFRQLMVPLLDSLLVIEVIDMVQHHQHEQSIKGRYTYCD
jgi:hypothetical protein